MVFRYQVDGSPSSLPRTRASNTVSMERFCMLSLFCGHILAVNPCSTMHLAVQSDQRHFQARTTFDLSRVLLQGLKTDRNQRQPIASDAERRLPARSTYDLSSAMYTSRLCPRGNCTEKGRLYESQQSQSKDRQTKAIQNTASCRAVPVPGTGTKPVETKQQDRGIDMGSKSADPSGAKGTNHRTSPGA